MLFLCWLGRDSSPTSWEMLGSKYEKGGESSVLHSVQSSEDHSGVALEQLKNSQKRQAAAVPPTASANISSETAPSAIPANIIAVTMNGDTPSVKSRHSPAPEAEEDDLCDCELPGFKGRAQNFRRLGNLRDERFAKRLPKGKCVYIQSGDPSDFDGALSSLARPCLWAPKRQASLLFIFHVFFVWIGSLVSCRCWLVVPRVWLSRPKCTPAGYLIARAGEILSRTTKDLVFVVVVSAGTVVFISCEELPTKQNQC